MAKVTVIKRSLELRLTNQIINTTPEGAVLLYYNANSASLPLPGL